MQIEAKAFGSWSGPARLTTPEGHLIKVEPTKGTTDLNDLLLIAPALWDIQMNGRWGVSFSSPDLTKNQVIEIVRAQAHFGTGRVCPTLITASPSATSHGIRTIIAAAKADPLVDRMIAGIHLEGPWISEKDGYRGAHPLSCVCDPDPIVFETWFSEAEGRIALVTLAPERTGSIEMVAFLRSKGVAVALGHSAADGPTLKAASRAGATLSTHLGNGIASVLPRHPNPIWHQLADPALSASFIADGHHVDPETLGVLIRAKGVGRSILVSDYSPLAGLPVGRYGEWAVDPSGKIVVAGTPYLAGSNQGLREGLALLFSIEESLGEGVGTERILDTVTTNPARLLGRPPTQEDQASDYILFRRSNDRFVLEKTVVGGVAFSPKEPVCPW
jgi:N-acetylglucosamine-6-phosphate deacetylase